MEYLLVYIGIAMLLYFVIDRIDSVKGYIEDKFFRIPGDFITWYIIIVGIIVVAIIYFE